MRICFLMEPPRSKTSVTHDIVNGLKSGGADVEIVTERTGLVDLERFKFAYDFYLFKSHSPLAESLAAAAHYQGGTLLNEYPATMKVRDKVLTCLMLLQAGLPTPRTFVTDSLDTLADVVKEMPLVVKPFRGRRGQGIEVCMDEAQFAALVEKRANDAPAAKGDSGEDGTALA